MYGIEPREQGVTLSGFCLGGSLTFVHSLMGLFIVLLLRVLCSTRCVRVCDEGETETHLLTPEDPLGWLWGDRPRTTAVQRDAALGAGRRCWGHIEAETQRNPGAAGKEVSRGKGRKDVLDRENMNKSSETSWKTVKRKSSGEKKKGKTMSPVQMQKGTLVQDYIKLNQ